MDVLYSEDYNLVMIFSLQVGRIRQWGVKGALSIVDQGVYSGSNFLFSVFLARWLSPSEYGAYALAFAILLVFYQLHQSFITDPMGVLGPANYPTQLRDYMLVQLKLHFVITFIGGLLVGIASLGLASYLVGDAMLFARDLGVMGLSLPFLLLPWFLRRVFYVLHLPEISALASLFYAVGVFVVLQLFRYTYFLNSYTAILVLAIASLFCSVFLLLRLCAMQKTDLTIEFNKIFLQNWRYARWLVGSALFMVLAGQMQIFVAGNLLGVKDAGVIDVMQTFSQPMILTIGAVSALVTPRLSYDYTQKKIFALKHKVNVVAAFLFCLSLFYEVMLFFSRGSLERILYNGKFGAYVDLIPLFGLVPVLLSLYWSAAIGLQAAQKPQAIMLVSLAWFPASVGFGFFFTRWFGLRGAALGTILGYLVIVIVCWVLYRRWIKVVAHVV